jgi:catalase
MEDNILREKITHFDHERIPERVVHARGSGAHGYFECYQSLSSITKADLFQTEGQITEVFVRFSTVAGGAGSVDLPRDVRGFATRFYTNEGNWDLVGNNIPVFFIQGNSMMAIISCHDLTMLLATDWVGEWNGIGCVITDAMKFPDLIHAVKMEPDRGFPQAASAHRNFWDFVSLMPESLHMIMWAMSDRTIPRSFRTIEGFGVNTFTMVNSTGGENFVKFHWKPAAGNHYPLLIHCHASCLSQ